MNKILMLLLATVALTSCTTTKTTQIDQPTNEAVSAPKTLPELSSMISMLNDELNIGLLIKNQQITPDGNLVLTLNEFSPFVEDAIVIIPPDKFDSLKGVMRSIKSIVSISKSRGARPIDELDFSLGSDKVATRHEQLVHPTQRNRL